MKIKIYTTSTCPFCKMEKAFLNSKGITYENISVEDPEAAQKMIDESGQMGVPFTEITKDDGTLIKVLGFDKQKLEEALEL